MVEAMRLLVAQDVPGVIVSMLNDRGDREQEILAVHLQVAAAMKRHLIGGNPSV